MKLIFSPAALMDLELIADYTRRVWGEKQEVHYLEGLWEKLEDLIGKPANYKLRPDLLENCRSARFRKHVIFFAIESRSVEVIRILHSAMDFYSQLKPE